MRSLLLFPLLFLLSLSLVGSGFFGGGGGASAAQINLTGTYSSLPAAGVDGRTFLATDAFYTILRDNGSTWQHFFNSRLLTLPINTDFSWVNQGTATVIVNRGGVLLTAPAVVGTNLRIRIKSAPATPYTITAGFYSNQVGIDSESEGLVFRESATGELITQSANRGLVDILRFTSPTLFSSASFTDSWSYPVGITWFRMTDDGTDLTWSLSGDGQNYNSFHTESRTAFMAGGPNQVGFYTDSSNVITDTSIMLIHWIEE